MGNINSLTPSLFRKEAKILIHGLDASGKTMLLYQLKTPHDVKTTIPTIGFNVESIAFNGYTLTAWDVGGRSKMRGLWKHYYPDTDGLIFIIDSADEDRLDEAAFQMQRICSEPELSGIPMLIFCNKQDLPKALTVSEVSERIGIDGSGTIDGHPVLVAGCSASSGVGVNEGLRRLTALMKLDGPTRIETAFKQQQAQQGTHIAVHKVLDHDPVVGNLPLQAFQTIQRNSQCPFARTAKLWGSKMPTTVQPPSSPLSKTLEQQAKETAPALAEFIRRFNSGERLDGFCIDLDDPMAREGNPHDLGICVRQYLTTLVCHDPSLSSSSAEESNCMTVTKCIGHRGWQFRFCHTEFFLTTFAPCYPTTSSRYGFGSDRAFLLMQPDESFARHTLPPDTPNTNWAKPRTIRDKARVAFAEAGRGYLIPESTTYPSAAHVVKPLYDDGKQIICWWEQEDLTTTDADTDDDDADDDASNGNMTTTNLVGASSGSPEIDAIVGGNL